MCDNRKIYEAVYKELCPDAKLGERKLKLKSVTDIVNTVLYEIKNLTIKHGELRLKYLGKLEIVKGDEIRATMQLRPSLRLEAELNYSEKIPQKAHRFWNEDESAELMRLNVIRESEKFLGFEWVSRCLTGKFGLYRTAKSCKERVDRIRELEAKNGQ